MQYITVIAKLNFQPHYSSLRCHMILKKKKILICWFVAQETFLIPISVENCCAASYFCGNHDNICFRILKVHLCLIIPYHFPGYDIFERNSMAEAPIAAPAFPVPLRQGCFYLLVFVPISCALLQLLAWSRFTLHGRRLQNIKTLRQGAQHSHLIDVKAI